MYLFFDTETTGLPPNYNAPLTDFKNWPRMVQIAWVYQNSSGQVVDRACHIIKPQGYSIPIDASNLHRITTNRAKQEGVELVWVLERFNKLVNESIYIVAHNISFDEKIIGAEFLRNKMTNSLQGKHRICTMEKSVNFCGLKTQYGYKRPKLSELHWKLFECNFDGAHDAHADISATVKCFWELRRRGIL
jgi:DNA polymerase-3 subunit epsilon